MILLFQSDISGVLIFLSCKFLNCKSGGLTRLVPDPAQACRCPSAVVCHAPDVNCNLTRVHSRSESNGLTRFTPRRGCGAYAAAFGGRIDVTISVRPRPVRVA
jgi:hypothetical protein